MSKRHIPTDGGPNLDGDVLRERGLRPPPGLSFWRRVWWWFDFIVLVNLARLRFIAILFAIGVVIASWDTLKSYYEKWARPVSGAETASADTEFWCPMHPTIVRDHPDKCPICGMPLSKRKKGEGGAGEPLPPGVVSRVQLTPYRVAVAGIQTTEVTYHPLTKEIQTVGTVEFDERKLRRIPANVKGRIDKLYANVTGDVVRPGDPLARIYSPDVASTLENLFTARPQDKELVRDRLRRWGLDDVQLEEIEKEMERIGKAVTHVTIRSPIGGHIITKYQVQGEWVEESARLYDVADLHTVWIEAQVYEDEVAFLKDAEKKKLPVSATTKAFPSREFKGTVAFIHPHLDAASRTLKVRFDIDNPDHDLRPGMYATVKLQVPATQLTLFSSALAEEWRDQTAADLAAHALFDPAGLPKGSGLESLLRAAERQVLAGQGQVLAVPERAVIDTGSRKIVYREAEPGVFEGVEVQLGPRSGGLFPVVQGLGEGDRVATTGSFLIDAETRLTAGAGSTYFGASGGPQGEKRSAVTARPSMTGDEESKVKAALAKLSAADRRLAEAQEFCPILHDNRLGMMGVPIKVIVKDQPVLLCCTGCVKEALANPDKTLAKVKELEAKDARSRK
jgi:Cu(I)/Ag(I) efflux system membrane fusion protein